jgi:hypothetical protein
VGKILKGFGNFPDLYRDNISPILPSSQQLKTIQVQKYYFEYTSTTFAGISKSSSIGPGKFCSPKPFAACAASCAAIFSNIKSAKFVPGPSA